jgi:hypothetical protein
MIEFKAKNAICKGYTITVPGNKGEEELVIICSPGQDMKWRVVIVAASVDGGMQMLYNTTAFKRGSDLPDQQTVLSKIHTIVLTWARGGIQPTEKQNARVYSEVSKLMKRIYKFYCWHCEA